MDLVFSQEKHIYTGFFYLLLNVIGFRLMYVFLIRFMFFTFCFDKDYTLAVYNFGSSAGKITRIQGVF